LKALYQEENDRQNILEGKSSQLTGQTGVIFSLLGLFIPMYFDKFSHLVTWLQVALVLLFAGTLLFYLGTLFYSTKYLNVDHFQYMRRTAGTVTEQYNTEDDFLIEEAKDLIHSIKHNTTVNDRKAEYLVSAYRSFKAANILVGIFSLLLLLSIFLLPKVS